MSFKDVLGKSFSNGVDKGFSLLEKYDDFRTNQQIKKQEDDAERIKSYKEKLLKMSDDELKKEYKKTSLMQKYIVSDKQVQRNKSATIMIDDLTEEMIKRGLL